MGQEAQIKRAEPDPNGSYVPQNDFCLSLNLSKKNKLQGKTPNP